MPRREKRTDTRPFLRKRFIAGVDEAASSGGELFGEEQARPPYVSRWCEFVNFTAPKCLDPLGLFVRVKLLHVCRSDQRFAILGAGK